MAKPKYPKNTILHTKNGRYIGNAIIHELPNKENGEQYHIITDYGTLVLLSEFQIDELFRPAIWLTKGEQQIAQESHKHYNPK